MFKNILAAISALTLCAGTMHAQIVQLVKPGDNLNYGITYCLPQTAVVVSVQSTCVKTVAGPYADYAERFLGIKDVIYADQSEWEINQITLHSTPVADPTRTYHIEFSEKGALPAFYLTDDRCLCSINRAPQVFEPLPAEKTEEVKGKPAIQASDVLTGEILKAGSKTKQAELIAQEIFSIRESRTLLIKGEADNMPGDGASLQLMLDNLQAQEDALLTLFIGTSTQSTQTRNYTYIPTRETSRDLVFRFSKHLGFVDADDYAGEPYYISLQITEDARQQVVDPKGKKRLDKGIAYCIPSKAHLTLLNNKGNLAEGDMLMGQFGRVEQLPQAQFTDKKRPCSASFNATTGAIKLFEQQ